MNRDYAPRLSGVYFNRSGDGSMDGGTPLSDGAMPLSAGMPVPDFEQQQQQLPLPQAQQQQMEFDERGLYHLVLNVGHRVVHTFFRAWAVSCTTIAMF